MEIRNNTRDENLLSVFMEVPSERAAEILIEARKEALKETKVLLKEQFLQAILEQAVALPVKRT